jgi:hypothetical protein
VAVDPKRDEPGDTEATDDAPDLLERVAEAVADLFDDEEDETPTADPAR